MLDRVAGFDDHVRRCTFPHSSSASRFVLLAHLFFFLFCVLMFVFSSFRDGGLSCSLDVCVVCVPAAVIVTALTITYQRMGVDNMKEALNLVRGVATVCVWGGGGGGVASALWSFVVLTGVLRTNAQGDVRPLCSVSGWTLEEDTVLFPKNADNNPQKRTFNTKITLEGASARPFLFVALWLVSVLLNVVM